MSAVAYAIASDDTRYVMISTMQNSQPGLELYHVRDDVVAFDDDFAPLAGLQLNASTDSVVTMPLLAVSGACTRSVHGGVCVLNMGMGVYVYMCEPCVRVHVCVCFACACVCVCMRVCVCVCECVVRPAAAPRLPSSFVISAAPAVNTAAMSTAQGGAANPYATSDEDDDDDENPATTVFCAVAIT